jgi:DNA-binding transcriptional LysR family regulator
VNLDLNHVQAFVTTAELLHFGRAAQHLHLTQQGLSHRVSRLERVLGAQLFVRDGRTVELTPGGRRFLPHARQLLVAAEAAVAEARDALTPVRVDVWGQLHAPLRWLVRLAALDGQMPLEVSMRRGMRAAIEAVRRGEIDAAFGRLPDRPLPPDLRYELIGVEPLGVVVGPGHPLAGCRTVAADQLRGRTMWHPATGTAFEVVDFDRQLAAHYGMRVERSGSNLGMEHQLAGLARRPDWLAILPLNMHPGFIPVTDPTPYYPWMMVWRENDRSDRLAVLRHALVGVAGADGPPQWHPATCWMPAADQVDLPAANDNP